MLKIGLVQQRFKGSRDDTVAYTKSEIERLAKNGAKLVILQELHTTEYFCQSESVEFFSYAKSYKNDLEEFSAVAKKNGVVLVGSFFEERAAGVYHNTAVVFEKDGSIAGRYRKMHIPDDPGFYEKFYFTPGDLGFEPIDTSVGRLGVLVCWDQWYPEAARLMALAGAEILIYPTAIGWFDSDEEDEKRRQLDAWVAVQRGHSVANGAYVIAVNRVGFESDSTGVIEGIRFWGNSFVFGPQGEEVYRAGGEEMSDIVEIDLERVAKVRNIWPFFRDRRIEAYGDILKRFRTP